MAVYRNIHVSFWQDPFISELTPEEKYFYLYLMTNSKTKQCGIYEISKKLMAYETGYNLETVEKLIARFVVYERILYCEETKELFILKWLKHNFSISPKIKRCIEKELAEVKFKPFIKQAIQYAYGIHRVCIDLGEEKEKTYMFTTFWDEYPRKEAKKDAMKAWKQVKADKELTETIISAVKERIKTQEWQKDNGKFIPLAATYLRGERWKDALPKTREPTHQVIL